VTDRPTEHWQFSKHTTEVIDRVARSFTSLLKGVSVECLALSKIYHSSYIVYYDVIMSRSQINYRALTAP